MANAGSSGKIGGGLWTTASGSPLAGLRRASAVLTSSPGPCCAGGEAEAQIALPRAARLHPGPLSGAPHATLIFG